MLWWSQIKVQRGGWGEWFRFSFVLFPSASCLSFFCDHQSIIKKGYDFFVNILQRHGAFVAKNSAFFYFMKVEVLFFVWLSISWWLWEGGGGWNGGWGALLHFPIIQALFPVPISSLPTIYAWPETSAKRIVFMFILSPIVFTFILSLFFLAFSSQDVWPSDDKSSKQGG